MAATWLAIALLSIAGAIVLTVAIIDRVSIPFDKPLLALATSWSAWNLAWNVLSEMGNYPMIPIGLGFVVWLWWTKHRREAVLVAIMQSAENGGRWTPVPSTASSAAV